jgi:hypothetical protein
MMQALSSLCETGCFLFLAYDLFACVGRSRHAIIKLAHASRKRDELLAFSPIYDVLPSLYLLKSPLYSLFQGANKLSSRVLTRMAHFLKGMLQ